MSSSAVDPVVINDVFDMTGEPDSILGDAGTLTWLQLLKPTTSPSVSETKCIVVNQTNSDASGYVSPAEIRRSVLKLSRATEG